MVPLEPVTLSFGAALLLGLSFGSGPCNLACLPYLGPVLTLSDQGLGGAWRTLLPFSLGRVTGYSLVAGIAGWFGLWVEELVAGPWVRWLLGAATIIVALSILWRRRMGKDAPACHTPQTGVDVNSLTSNGHAGVKAGLPGGLYLMGMGMALNPCAPMTTVILASATSASLLTGASLGAGFGLGAVVIPTLIFTFGVAHFGQQVRHYLVRHRMALENISIAMLVFVGCATGIGWVTP